MRIGGGLGGTRRGGPDVNIKHSGREDNERERERYRLEREREDRSGGAAISGSGGMDRRADFRDRSDRKLNNLNKKKKEKNKLIVLFNQDSTIVVDLVHRGLTAEKENDLNIAVDQETVRSEEVVIGETVVMEMIWIDVVIEVTVKRIRRGRIDHGRVIDQKGSEIVVTKKGIGIAKTGNPIYVKVTSKSKKSQSTVSWFSFVFFYSQQITVLNSEFIKSIDILMEKFA